jgi:hypothetical protein
MPGILDAIFGNDTETLDQLREHTGDDPKKAEQAYNAAAGTILRGIEEKSQTPEGAQSIWDMLKKHVEQGNLPAEAPAEGSGVQVRDMDPKVANDIFKSIFGQDAPDVQNGYAKVITLDQETSKKVMAKVLPSILGGIFGAAESHPEDSPKALPKVVTDARNEMEQRQPNAANIFDAILDTNHDGKVDLNDLAGLLGRKPK